MALHAVESAYSTTLHTKTAKFTLAETINGTGSSGSKLAQTVTGAGESNFVTHAFDMSINAPTGGAIQIVETGGIAYTKLPTASLSQVPGHKPWVSVNLNKLLRAKLGGSFSQLSSTNDNNPAQVLSNLSAVSGNVTKIGAATIGATKTTEYAATVDLNKVAAKIRAKAGAKAAQAITAEEQAMGTHTFPVKVWVDSSGLLRRAEESIPLPASSGGRGTMTLVMTFSAYGAPVSIMPPPASQVTDITAQVIQQAKAGPASAKASAG
ncbi:MAG: hypothetical protein ACYDH5_00820 [Acidimicrobiales bacterium]